MTLTDSATLADVARMAGVSSATASRVLTGSARVRPQTRDKVKQAMSDLGYARNRAARPDRRQAGSIALVFCEETARLFADPFFARMLWGLSKVLSSADLQLIVLTLFSSRDYHTVTRYLRGDHVDGALFVSMHGRSDFDFTSLDIPLVCCGRPTVGPDALTYVDADNVGGAMSAVRYLLSTGRTSVATIAGPKDMSPGIDRLLGYRKAMATADVSDSGLVAYGDFTLASGEHAMYRLIDRRPSLDAVFVASDLMAAGALRALRRLGRRVPGTVAVVGFDDSPLAQHTDPRLSTVRQPVDVMAAWMAEQLLDLIASPGGAPRQLIVDTQLVLRDSA